MKRCLPQAPLALIVAAAFGISALADDASVLLRKSQQAMLDVPAMRMTMETIDHTKNKTTEVLTEFAHPDQMHYRITVDGKVDSEIVCDGQKAFMRRGDEPFHPMPGNVIEMFTNARKSASLEGIAEMASNAKLVGHEDVNGIASSVYTFKTEAMGLTGSSKVWISDKDNLPLKAERHTQGQTKVGASPGIKVDRDSKITFDYDSSIKITVPTG